VILGNLKKEGFFESMMKDPKTGQLVPIPISVMIRVCVASLFFFFCSFPSEIHLTHQTNNNKFALFTGRTTVALGLFCAVISIVLFFFAGYHIFLIKRNETTNETYKRKDYRRYVNHYLKAKREAEQSKEGNQKSKPKKEELPEPIFKLDKNGKVVIENIYNKGFLSNLKEVLNPPSYRSRPQNSRKNK
jgi:hypothetical protein